MIDPVEEIWRSGDIAFAEMVMDVAALRAYPWPARYGSIHHAAADKELRRVLEALWRRGYRLTRAFGVDVPLRAPEEVNPVGEATSSAPAEASAGPEVGPGLEQ